GIKVGKWPNTTRSASIPASTCSSATRIHRGSAAATRTPTAYYVSTSPKAPTSRSTTPPHSKPPPTASTVAPARPSTGKLPPNDSPNSLRRPVEPTADISDNTAPGQRLRRARDDLAIRRRVGEH